jgi:CDP-paratose 2-epimerase
VKLLITGAAGFVGSRMAEELKARRGDLELFGIDNLARRGSETNLPLLARLGCQFFHGDVRNDEDLAELPRADWVIDCAANPSVLAGVSGGTRSLVSHNLGGTLNLLEKCRRDGAGLILLSSSRVYSIDALGSLPLDEDGTRLRLRSGAALPPGMSPAGVTERFSTAAPISLYGATKLTSEIMALEYGATFGFPVWVDRCGVIAGPGQFGKIDQGIFSFWIYQWLRGRPLAYIGYGGRGQQVRDLLAPGDLAELLDRQLRAGDRKAPRVVNAGGGLARAMSLRELSDWCRRALGTDHPIGSVPETRPFDIPYYVTDNTLVQETWGWQPAEPRDETLERILRWARQNPAALEIFAP